MKANLSWRQWFQLESMRFRIIKRQVFLINLDFVTFRTNFSKYFHFVIADKVDCYHFHLEEFSGDYADNRNWVKVY